MEFKQLNIHESVLLNINIKAFIFSKIRNNHSQLNVKKHDKTIIDKTRRESFKSRIKITLKNKTKFNKLASSYSK